MQCQIRKNSKTLLLHLFFLSFALSVSCPWLVSYHNFKLIKVINLECLGACRAKLNTNLKLFFEFFFHFLKLLKLFNVNWCLILLHHNTHNSPFHLLEQAHTPHKQNYSPEASSFERQQRYIPPGRQPQLQPNNPDRLSFSSWFSPYGLDRRGISNIQVVGEYS